MKIWIGSLMLAVGLAGLVEMVWERMESDAWLVLCAGGVAILVLLAALEAFAVCAHRPLNLGEDLECVSGDVGCSEGDRDCLPGRVVGDDGTQR